MNFKEDKLRDQKRIRKFCNELADVWGKECGGLASQTTYDECVRGDAVWW